VEKNQYKKYSSVIFLFINTPSIIEKK